MIDQTTAARIAINHLSRQFCLEHDEIVVFDPLETSDHWIFKYNSRRFLETNDLIYAIVEGKPIAVNKHDGSIE